jgi:hypothetical protein
VCTGFLRIREFVEGKELSLEGLTPRGVIWQGAIDILEGR